MALTKCGNDNPKTTMQACWFARPQVGTTVKCAFKLPEALCKDIVSQATHSMEGVQNLLENCKQCLDGQGPRGIVWKQNSNLKNLCFALVSMSCFRVFLQSARRCLSC